MRFPSDGSIYKSLRWIGRAVFLGVTVIGLALTVVFVFSSIPVQKIWTVNSPDMGNPAVLEGDRWSLPIEFEGCKLLQVEWTRVESVKLGCRLLAGLRAVERKYYKVRMSSEMADALAKSENARVGDFYPSNEIRAPAWWRVTGRKEFRSKRGNLIWAGIDDREPDVLFVMGDPRFEGL